MIRVYKDMEEIIGATLLVAMCLVAVETARADLHLDRVWSCCQREDRHPNPGHEADVNAWFDKVAQILVIRQRQVLEGLTVETVLVDPAPVAV